MVVLEAMGKDVDESLFHRAVREMDYDGVKFLIPLIQDQKILSSGFIEAVHSFRFRSAHGIMVHWASRGQAIPIDDPGHILRYAALEPNPLLYALLEKGIHPDTPAQVNAYINRPQVIYNDDGRRHYQYQKLPVSYFEGTPLAIASGQNQAECIEALLTHRADVNAEEGMAICRAAEFKCGEAVEDLLRAGASKNLSSAIFLAASTPCNGSDTYSMRRTLSLLLNTEADLAAAVKEAIKEDAIVAVMVIGLEIARHNSHVEMHQAVSLDIPNRGARSHVALDDPASIRRNLRTRGNWSKRRASRIALSMSDMVELLVTAIEANLPEILHLLVDHFPCTEPIEVLNRNPAVVEALRDAAQLEHYPIVKTVLILEDDHDAEVATRLLVNGADIRDVLAACNTYRWKGEECDWDRCLIVRDARAEMRDMRGNRDSNESTSSDSSSYYRVTVGATTGTRGAEALPTAEATARCRTVSAGVAAGVLGGVRGCGTLATTLLTSTTIKEAMRRSPTMVDRAIITFPMGRAGVAGCTGSVRAGDVPVTQTTVTTCWTIRTMRADPVRGTMWVVQTRILSTKT
ncbi:hypothetical protein HDV00_004911 [Rhizophlyctis rosea]|nr:hypothetical protein HDV00_004911 [Rhizophlyctis rosea]